MVERFPSLFNSQLQEFAGVGDQQTLNGAFFLYFDLRNFRSAEFPPAGRIRLASTPLSRGLGVLLRKEVIQPQVPLRLPCYDFIPVTAHSVGRCLLAVSVRTFGYKRRSHDVTGGVGRERIHGAVADAPLLAIPASWRRIAASNPNWAQF